jgi:hypothetical protein
VSVCEDSEDEMFCIVMIIYHQPGY